jgi:hypothetical protein
MKLKTSTKIKIVTSLLAVNALFGLYNLKVTERVKPLSEKQKKVILLLNTLDTSNGLIHLLVNVKLGAYKK